MPPAQRLQNLRHHDVVAAKDKRILELEQQVADLRERLLRVTS